MIDHSIERLKQLYTEAATLRDHLNITGAPGTNLFENGMGCDGDFDHELLVVADGLGGATLMLMDQGCLTHSKVFTSEDEALRVAERLSTTASGMNDDNPPRVTMSTGTEKTMNDTPDQRRRPTSHPECCCAR